MQITVAITSQSFKKGELSDKTVVVVDVLRTSSTIVAALQHGCERVIPAYNPSEAAEIRNVTESDVLLGGETDMMKVQGFDLGNSPLEYLGKDILEKTVILSAADGTSAIKGCAGAGTVLIGCLLNAEALASAVLQIGRDTVMVCAGVNGKFSTDDVIGVGCILDRIMQSDPSADMDDLGHLALRVYRRAKSNMLQFLEGCVQYERLSAAGYLEDVTFCLQEDIFSVVPVYKEGIIVKSVRKN